MKDIIKAYQQDSTEEQKQQLTEVKEQLEADLIHKRISTERISEMQIQLKKLNLTNHKEIEKVLSKVLKHRYQLYT